MLWFCKWPDRSSLLLVAATKSEARKMATEIAHEADPSDGAPSEVVDVPWFVAEVAEGDDDRLVVEPLDHVSDLLDGVERGDDTPAECTAEAVDGDGAVVRCARERGHGGSHDTGDLVWE